MKNIKKIILLIFFSLSVNVSQSIQAMINTVQAKQIAWETITTRLEHIPQEQQLQCAARINQIIETNANKRQINSEVLNSIIDAEINNDVLRQQQVATKTGAATRTFTKHPQRQEELDAQIARQLLAEEANEHRRRLERRKREEEEATRRFLTQGERSFKAAEQRNQQIEADARLARELQAQFDREQEAMAQYNFEAERLQAIDEREERDAALNALLTQSIHQRQPGARLINPLSFNALVPHFSPCTPAQFDPRMGILKETMRPGVYHVWNAQTELQQNGWSCGFHCLANALRIEEKIHNRPPISFIQEMSQQGYSSESLLTSCLAEELGITSGLNMCYLMMNAKIMGRLGNFNQLFSDKPTDIILGNIRLQGQFTQRRGTAVAATNNVPGSEVLKKFGENNPNKPTITHFICHLELTEGPHGVLVSVIINPDRTAAIYIYDNLMYNDGRQQFIHQGLDHHRTDLPHYINALVKKLFGDR